MTDNSIEITSAPDPAGGLLLTIGLTCGGESCTHILDLPIHRPPCRFADTQLVPDRIKAMPFRPTRETHSLPCGYDVEIDASAPLKKVGLKLMNKIIESAVAEGVLPVVFADEPTITEPNR